MPCHLEPTGLYRNDGKRPDGATVPWKWGKVLVWDATCHDTLGPSHSSLVIRESSAVAADAKYRKRQKYAHLENTHFFCFSCGGDSRRVWGGGSVSIQGHWSAHYNGNTGPAFPRISSSEDCGCCAEGNAAAVLGTISSGDNNNEFYLFMFFFFLIYIIFIS